MSDRRRLLIVVNEARRTGAPLGVLRMLQSLDREHIECVVVLRRRGPLLEELRALADRLVVEPAGPLEALLARMRWRRVPLGPISKLDRTIAGFQIDQIRPDAVFADTVTNGDYAHAAAERQIPTVLYAQEIGAVLNRFVRAHALRRCAEQLVVAANSQATAAEVATRLNLPTERIEVIPPPFDLLSIRELAREDASATIDEPSGGSMVVGCGVVSKIKGPERWLSMAEGLVHNHGSNVRFVWVGEGRKLQRMRAVTAHRGLSDNVRWIGGVPNPYPLLAKADVVAITSRSESLSRVAVEALALGTPIVAFDVGGISEAVGCCGVLVPPANTSAMGDAVSRLLDDRPLRRRLGVCGRARVDLLFDQEVFRAHLFRLIDRILGLE